jgi:hypothetical protein
VARRCSSDYGVSCFQPDIPIDYATAPSDPKFTTRSRRPQRLIGKPVESRTCHPFRVRLSFAVPGYPILRIGLRKRLYEISQRVPDLLRRVFLKEMRFLDSDFGLVGQVRQNSSMRPLMTSPGSSATSSFGSELRVMALAYSSTIAVTSVVSPSTGIWRGQTRFGSRASRSRVAVQL